MSCDHSSMWLLLLSFRVILRALNTRGKLDAQRTLRAWSYIFVQDWTQLQIYDFSFEFQIWVSLSEKIRQFRKIEVGCLPSLFEKINDHDICRGRRLFFFEISPYHYFGPGSSLKWPKFRATLGEKRYFTIRLRYFAPRENLRIRAKDP